MTACSTSSSKTVDPPMSAEGPATARDAGDDAPGRHRLGLDCDARVDEPRASALLAHGRCDGDDARDGGDAPGDRLRVVQDDDVHRRGEPGPGERLGALGRDPDLGVARELVEPAVERLHGDERRSDREQHAGAGERATTTGWRMTAIRPARPEHVAPLLGRPPRQPDAQPVDAVPLEESSAVSKRRRCEHGDADDDDRADRHRPEGGDVDREQRGERHRDRRAAEHDCGAGGRERARGAPPARRPLAELARGTG